MPDNGVQRPDVLAQTLERLKDYGSTFSDKVLNLISQLQVHPDLDGRFLGIRLAFSDFYKNRKDQSSTQTLSKT